MEKTSVLPDNCLACPNTRQTRAWADGEFLIGKIDVRCQFGQGLVMGVGVSKDAVITPPEECPLIGEKQPWINDTPILGCIWIEVEELGEIKSLPFSGNPSLPLIDRANWALGLFTRVPVVDREGSLGLVSVNLKARRAVFRQKRTA